MLLKIECNSNRMQLHNLPQLSDCESKNAKHLKSKRLMKHL